MVKLWHKSARRRSVKTRNGMGAEDPYEFQALRTSTAIRLIEIRPKKVKRCIACRIYDFDEEEQKTVHYQALSYLWGDSQPTRQIFVKGPDNGWHPFPLHENLWQFLNHAWRQKMFGQLFWTDRLCLNQDNPDEIAQQVPRMHTIYQSAELVLIWLHLKEEEERYLFELLGRFHSQHRTLLKSDLTKRLAALTDADRDISLRLTQNPYWARIWIVQEVVLPRKVSVICGDSLIPLDKLASLFQWFLGRNDLGKPSIWVLSDMRSALGKWPLSRILIEFSEHQSSRPADRVYGMLGMVEDNPDGSSPTDNIQVDYGKPILHILLDATFESSPHVAEYDRLPRCLGDWTTHGSHSLLKGYIAHKKTTERHKRLAMLSLQTLEALNIIKFVPGAPSGELMEATNTLAFSSLPEWTTSGWNWKPTLEQHAAITGLALGWWSSSPLDHWDARRRVRGQASSPWRCAAHWSIEMTPSGTSTYGPVVGMVASQNWAGDGVVAACRERSPSCDGSIVAWEIPHVGLHLLLSVNGHCGKLVLQRRQE